MTAILASRFFSYLSNPGSLRKSSKKRITFRSSVMQYTYIELRWELTMELRKENWRKRLHNKEPLQLQSSPIHRAHHRNYCLSYKVPGVARFTTKSSGERFLSTYIPWQNLDSSVRKTRICVWQTNIQSSIPGRGTDFSSWPAAFKPIALTSGLLTDK
jgi:hypothetical protein